MGDMREEYDAYKEATKERKKKHTVDVLELLESYSDVDLEEKNASQGHYIMHFDSGARLQVWVSTVKFNVIGTNVYDGGFRPLKKQISKMIKE